MLCVFRVDTSNAYISVSIFARQGCSSQVRSHIQYIYIMVSPEDNSATEEARLAVSSLSESDSSELDI